MEASTSENRGGIYIYSTHPSSAIKEAPALLRLSEASPVFEIAALSELGELLLKELQKDEPYGCVAFHVREVEDLSHLAELMHSLKSEVASGTFQFVVLCQLDHPKLEKLFAKLKCHKVVYPPFSSKALKFACARHLTAAKKALKSDIRARTLSGATQNSFQSLVVQEKHVKEVDAIKTPDDCWIARATAARLIHGRWLCVLVGPGPLAGNWVEVHSETGHRSVDERVWEWRAKSGAEGLFVKDGVWRFHGRQPEFRDGLWTFIGTAPELSYFTNTRQTEKRLYTEELGSLCLAKNSKAALGKLIDIKASIEFEIILKNEGTKSTLLEHIERRRREKDVSFADRVRQSQELDFQLEREIARLSGNLFLSAGEEDVNAAPSAKPFCDGKFGNKEVAPSRIKKFKKADELFAATSKFFKEVASLTGKNARIKDACQSQSPATLWTAKRKLKWGTDVLSEGEHNGIIEIAYPEDFNAERFLAQIKSQDADRLYLNINTRRTSLFFAQSVDEIRFLEHAIRVEVPATIYEVQRRDHFRYQFPDESSLHVLIGLMSNVDFAIQAIARDISVGGIKVVHDVSDSQASVRARSLEMGHVFPNISFELFGKKVHCSGQLRWKKETPAQEGKPGTVIMGIQFIKVSSEDREGIRLFVMDQSYDYIESVLDAEEGADAASTGKD